MTRRLPLDALDAAGSDGSGSPSKQARRTPSTDGSPRGRAGVAPANAAHLLQPETVGRAQLAAALQTGLGLDAPRARAGANATLDPPPVAAKPVPPTAEELSSRSVRMRLHALLESA